MRNLISPPSKINAPPLQGSLESQMDTEDEVSSSDEIICEDCDSG